MSSCTIVGLTGGIASGKSTVSNYLRKHGLPVFDADTTGHALMQFAQPAWQDIVAVFGKEILSADQQIDRKKLGAIVFADHEKLRQLEGILHNRIRQQAHKFIVSNKQAGYRLIILDVPLLIEAGWDQEVDEVWLVYLNTAEQIRRATLRDNESAEAIKQRIDKQLPFAEKKKFATRLIDNSGSLAHTHAQLDELLKTYNN